MVIPYKQINRKSGKIKHYIYVKDNEYFKNKKGIDYISPQSKRVLCSAALVKHPKKALKENGMSIVVYL